MRVLISHTNFPAQFRRLAPALVQQGVEVVFLAKIGNGTRLNQFQECGYHLWSSPFCVGKIILTTEI